MKESVLMKIIGGLLLVAFLSLTGCGSGSDPIFKDSKVSSDITKQEELAAAAKKKAELEAAAKKKAEEEAAVAKKKAEEEAAAKKKAEEEAAAAKKKYRYYGSLQNIGSISGANIFALDGNKAEITHSVTDKNGRYFFDLTKAPSFIKIDSNGGLETLSSFASYLTKCNAEIFHTFKADQIIECQPITLNKNNSDLNITQAKLLRSYLAHAYDSMGILDTVYNKEILKALSDADDIDGIVIILDGVVGLNEKQQTIIENIARIVSGTDANTITTAMLALDIAIKLDNDNSLKGGDGGVTEWINMNKNTLKEYLENYSDSDIQSLSLRLTQKIQNGELVGVKTLAELILIIIPKDVAKCVLSSSVEVCFPSPELLIFKGTYDKSGVEVNDIVSLRTVFQKKDGVSEFKVFDEYVQFNSSVLENNTTENRFDLISENKDNLFTTHFIPEIDNTGLAGKKFLAVSIFEFFENNDETQISEYLTMVFRLDANVLSDKNLTLFMPSDSDIFFYSKIKDSNTSYEKVAISLKNNTKHSLISDKGSVVIDPMKYFDKIFNKMSDNDKIIKMKKFIVEHSSNKGGVPGLFIKNLALIDISSDLNATGKNFIKNGIEINSLNYGLSNSVNDYKDNMPTKLKLVRVKSYFK